MNLLKEASFEMRYRSGTMLRLFGVFTAIMIMVLIAVAVIAMIMMNNVKPPSGDEVDERIPTTAYGYAAVQVFDCVRTGPKCENFDKSKNYLIMSTVAGGIEYQPLKSTDPGEATGRETKIVKFTDESTDQQFRAFGDAVTLNGALSPLTVKETDFTEKEVGKITTFELNGEGSKADRDGTITLSLTDKQVVIRSIIYEDAPN